VSETYPIPTMDGLRGKAPDICPEAVDIVYEMPVTTAMRDSATLSRIGMLISLLPKASDSIKIKNTARTS
jgi:hypothetical protein